MTVSCKKEGLLLAVALLFDSYALLQEEYELDNGTAMISPCAPKHWRERHEVHGVGAFHELHVGP